jgi:hypothetical protein
LTCQSASNEKRNPGRIKQSDHQDNPRRMSLPPPMMQNTHDRRAACLGASRPLSDRFLGQSVAKGINGMSHQYADAHNEGCSYNNSR